MARTARDGGQDSDGGPFAAGSYEVTTPDQRVHGGHPNPDDESASRPEASQSVGQTGKGCPPTIITVNRCSLGPAAHCAATHPAGDSVRSERFWTRRRSGIRS